MSGYPDTYDGRRRHRRDQAKYIQTSKGLEKRIREGAALRLNKLNSQQENGGQ